MHWNFGDGSDHLRKLIPTAKVAETLWHVGGDYSWMENALERRWHEFVVLKAEIDKAAADAEQKVPAEFERWSNVLRTHNPDRQVEEIEQKARELAGVGKHPMELVGRYLGSVMPLYVEVAILSAAVCEAHINLALAWGLAMRSNEGAFELVEQSTAINKWLHGPKLIVESYEFPRASAGMETLKKVFDERNRLMHPKSMVSTQGRVKMHGKMLKPGNLAAALRWVGANEGPRSQRRI